MWCSIKSCGSEGADFSMLIYKYINSDLRTEGSFSFSVWAMACLAQCVIRCACQPGWNVLGLFCAEAFAVIYCTFSARCACPGATGSCYLQLGGHHDQLSLLWAEISCPPKLLSSDFKYYAINWKVKVTSWLCLTSLTWHFLSSHSCQC